MNFLKYDINKKTISQIKFDKSVVAKTESIFALGNGHIGIRSADEEKTAYNKENFFVNGIFNKDTREEVSELANLADLMTTPIYFNNEQFEVCPADDYNKTLFIKDGILQRTVVAHRDAGKFELTFERFVSRDDANIYAQKIQIKVLEIYNNKNKVSVLVKPGINGQVTNSGTQHFGEGKKTRPTKESLQMTQTTTISKRLIVHNLITKAFLNGKFIPGGGDDYIVEMKRRYIGFKINVQLKVGDILTLEKIMSVHTPVDAKKLLRHDTIQELANDKHSYLLRTNYADLKTASIAKMHSNVWNQFSLEIQGDESAKYDALALDFGIFHLNGFVPRHSTNMNVGAKGLSGEGYQGHTFWDTEFFINPIYLFNQPKVVRNLLTYRYKGIEGARAKAKEIKQRPEESNLEGAQYPWEMAWPTEGEVCPYWGQADVVTGEQVPIASRRQEIHVSADVAYAVDQYFHVTKDYKFMETMGYEMIIDTAIYYANRAELQEDGSYEIKDVMGPNEYKGNVDNNAYINMFAKYNIDLALKYIEYLKASKTKVWNSIDAKIPYEINCAKLKAVSSKLKQQVPNEDLIIAENDTFLQLPKVDVLPFQMLGDAGKKLFSTKEGHIRLSSQLVKQADVVLLLNILPHLYSKEVRKANFDYYEPITTHDSSLSPATYAIEAARLKNIDKAYSIFKYGINIDLGPAMHTSNAGIHAGSLAAIYQMIVFGFGGLDWHNGKLHIDPILPKNWTSLKYKFKYQGSYFETKINQETFSIELLSDDFKGKLFINAAGKTICYDKLDFVKKDNKILEFVVNRG